MSKRMTEKAVKAIPGKKVRIGYCDAQYLLRGHEPIGYTAGVYGWNYNVYIINEVVITTGYRGIIGRLPANLKQYEDAARAIWEDYTRPLDDQRQAVDQLLEDLLTKTFEEDHTMTTRSYQARKAAARAKAIDWQAHFADHDYSYQEISDAQDHFTRLAARYGLTAEFRENGII